MKKFLLVIFALSSALVGNAQEVAKKDMANMKDIPMMPRQKMERAMDAKRIGPKRTIDNDIYYTIPGALFGGWDVEGSGMGAYFSSLMLPPFVDVTYKNQMPTTSNSAWSITTSAGTTDLTEYAEENGDYISRYNPDGMYYTIALGTKMGRNTYQWNEDNYYVQTNARETNDNSYVQTNPVVHFSDGDLQLSMTAADLHGTRWDNGTAYRNGLSGYGFLSTQFLFGTGSVDGSPAYGFEQTYNPLLAPIYINSISVEAVTYNNYGPIPEGKTLKAYVMTLAEDGSVEDVIGTFEAAPSDTLDFSPEGSDTYGSSNPQTAYYGTLIYTNTEKFQDIFGNEYSLPLAIPAGKAWRIQFEGMNDEGVCLGVYGVYKSEIENTYIENGYILLEDGHAYTFQNPICPYIQLNANYEVIDVQTKDFLSAESQEGFPTASFNGWNVLRISADGQEVSNDGLENTPDFNMGCAFVGTSQPWFDEDEVANYDINFDAPDWVKGIQVDVSLYDGENLTGYNLVVPECEPLPAGVTGRSCVLNIVGTADITGNNPIIILQGDAKLEDVETGVSEITNNVVATNKQMYNMAGQRISKPVSGQVYIKEGRKYLNRK